MTPADAIALLRRGRCSAAKLAEAGCATCAATDEAIRVLVAEGARRAIRAIEDQRDALPIPIAREVLPLDHDPRPHFVVKPTGALVHPDDARPPTGGRPC